MSSALFSDYNYNKFILKNTNNTTVFDLKLKSRIFIQIGIQVIIGHQKVNFILLVETMKI